MHRRGQAIRASVALLATLAAAVAFAPAVAAQRSEAHYRLRRDPFAELWYHGLALAGAPSYGPLPLYSPAYRRTVSGARHARGVATRLDAVASDLRHALAADTVLELLHFVPLHFVGESPDAVLAALGAALSGPPSARAAAGSLGARARAVADALPGAARRALVLRFVDALADEWRAFHRTDRVSRGPDPAAVHALQQRWNRTVQPALAQFLGATGAHGTIVLVPAVGLEGRIARGGPGGTTVIVGTEDAGGQETAPLLAAVRELAFALVDVAPAGPPRDRLTMERERELAAVRGGALLLEESSPSLAASYRRLFTNGAAGFEAAYPIGPAAEAALRTAVARLGATGVHRRTQP